MSPALRGPLRGRLEFPCPAHERLDVVARLWLGLWCRLWRLLASGPSRSPDALRTRLTDSARQLFHPVREQYQGVANGQSRILVVLVLQVGDVLRLEQFDLDAPAVGERDERLRPRNR